MPSKVPNEISLEEFAELSDAPAGGRGGSSRAINWDAVLEAVNASPKTNTQVFNMICEEKDKFLFDGESRKDPNPGTIWVKLDKWVKDKVIRKAKNQAGTVFFGPIKA